MKTIYPKIEREFNKDTKHLSLYAEHSQREIEANYGLPITREGTLRFEQVGGYKKFGIAGESANPLYQRTIEEIAQEVAQKREGVVIAENDIDKSTFLENGIGPGIYPPSSVAKGVQNHKSASDYMARVLSEKGVPVKQIGLSKANDISQEEYQNAIVIWGCFCCGLSYFESQGSRAISKNLGKWLATGKTSLFVPNIDHGGSACYLSPIVEARGINPGSRAFNGYQVKGLDKIVTLD